MEEAILAAGPLLYKSIAISVAYKASLHVAMQVELRKKHVFTATCALYLVLLPLTTALPR